METISLCTHPNNLIPFIISLYFLVLSVHSFSPLLGIHPLDEKYFGSQVIKCKDDSKSFSRDRLNDNFCDCLDGTDEPGTSACPRGKFYCRNYGSTPKFVFSSRVNDQICDCCDGSDEYGSGINCPKHLRHGRKFGNARGLQKKALPLKKTSASPQRLWLHGFVRHYCKTSLCLGAFFLYTRYSSTEIDSI
ncbi:hypothetical protein OIU78_026960 [Salix suchowensis]|nr:hypothetical protein OIU78_026960 [Salix suchowensis]